MSENTYHLGDIVRLSARFELSSVLTDPTAVTLKLIPPSGTAFYVSPITKDSVGLYHYDYTPPILGTYKYRYYGTGAVVAESENTFRIDNN